jgi:hypothetical protein
MQPNKTFVYEMAGGSGRLDGLPAPVDQVTNVSPSAIGGQGYMPVVSGMAIRAHVAS